MKDSDQKKFCKSCKTLKSISEFHKNKITKDGHQFYCKDCLIDRFRGIRIKKRGGRPLMAGNATRWTAQEDEIVKKYFPVMSVPIIIKNKFLNRNAHAIYDRVRRLGIKKITIRDVETSDGNMTDDLPKNHDEYIKRLLKKPLIKMSLEELKDYLDHNIQDKLDNHTYGNEILQDVYKHLLAYFRILNLQTNILSAKSDTNRNYLQAILLYIKDRHPEDIDDLLHVAGEIQKERDMEIVEGLPQRQQDDILKKAHEMLKETLKEEEYRGKK